MLHGRRAPGAGIARRIGVEIGERLGQTLDMARFKAMFAGKGVEQVGLGKTPHDDDAIDQFALSVESKTFLSRPFRFPRDAPDAEIKRWRRAGVQGDFGAAKLFAQLRRREVEIGKSTARLSLNTRSPARNSSDTWVCLLSTGRRFALKADFRKAMVADWSILSVPN